MITENLEKTSRVNGKLADAGTTAAKTQDVTHPTPVAISERVHRSGHHPGAVWLGARSSLAAPLERALFEAGYHVVRIDDVQNPGEWSEGLIRGLYSAGMIVLYSSHTDGAKKKNLLTSAIQSNRVLDVEALNAEAGDVDLQQKIIAWVEGLRIVRPEESR